MIARGLEKDPTNGTLLAPEQPLTQGATFARSFALLSLKRYRGVLFANLALLSPMLQGLMNYSVLQAGMVMAPRGAGTLIAMLLVGRMVGRFDARFIIALGLGLTALSLYQMSHFSLLMGMRSLVSTGAAGTDRL